MGNGVSRDTQVLPERCKRRPWADTEIVLLIVMRACGISYKRIGRKLKREPVYCRSKYCKLNLGKR